MGGLVGRVDYGTLSSLLCHRFGQRRSVYVGGLAGYNDRGQVIHCYSTGRPSGSNNVGGLCGGKTTGTGYADTGNFWDAESSHTTVSAMGLGKTTAQMKLLSTFVDAGWDFGVPGQAGVWSLPQDSYPVLSWQLNEPPIPIAMPDVRGLSLEEANSVLTAAGLEVYGVDEIFDLSIDAGLISCSIPVSGAAVYPELTRIYLRVAKAFHYSGGDGSEGDPYKISTVTDWQELIVASTAPDEHFILTETIDFGGAEIKPVGYMASDLNFYGQFDGQGFAIRNAVIYLPDQDYVGLFGRVGSGGKICNLNVVDADITGRGYVGGLAGRVEYGTLSACYATGSVTAVYLLAGWLGCLGTLSAVCHRFGQGMVVAGWLGCLAGTSRPVMPPVRSAAIGMWAGWLGMSIMAPSRAVLPPVRSAAVVIMSAGWLGVSILAPSRPVMPPVRSAAIIMLAGWLGVSIMAPSRAVMPPVRSAAMMIMSAGWRDTIIAVRSSIVIRRAGRRGQQCWRAVRLQNHRHRLCGYGELLGYRKFANNGQCDGSRQDDGGDEDAFDVYGGGVGF